jgi:hypothetical protein
VELAVTYRQRTNDPGLTYEPQVSSDMKLWSSGAGNVEELIGVPLDGEFNEVTFKDMRPGLMGLRAFGKIRVTLP